MNILEEIAQRDFHIKTLMGGMNIDVGSPFSDQIKDLIRDCIERGWSDKTIEAYINLHKIMIERRITMGLKCPNRSEFIAPILDCLGIRPDAHHYNVLRSEVVRNLELGISLDEIQNIIVGTVHYKQLLEDLEQQRVAEEYMAKQQRLKKERELLMATLQKYSRQERYSYWGKISFKDLSIAAGPLSRVRIEMEENLNGMCAFAKRMQKKVDLQAKEEAERTEYLRLRNMEKERRLELLDAEALLEEAQEYMGKNIPQILMNDFKLYYTRKYKRDRDSLKQAVDAFMVECQLQALEPIIESNILDPSTKSEATNVPPSIKRHGNKTEVETRPDQAAFSAEVYDNCYGRCVVTASLVKARCSAAHLIEHRSGGIDHYTNGLWLRWDIHKLFDAALCAIDPATMKIWFCVDVLEVDRDLLLFNGHPLQTVKKPVNSEFLISRWEFFNR
ncbi:HNH endonuclease [Serratia fonticola]|uniref:HNH endonuclease n=1 Tax=Serratia fonticola TaxID=47917 RepID=UPI00398634E6